MQPDSLVFVAILGAWAAYLLPRWVTRRDALGQARGSDRHSMHMRVLPRRRRRRAGASSAPLLRTTTVTAPAAASRSVTTPLPSPAAAAAARRVRVLVGLLAAAGASWGATVIPGVHWWVGTPATALLLLDLVALALSGRRRARARREVARQVARRVGQAQRRVGAATPRGVRPARTVQLVPSLAGRETAEHPTVELPAVPAATASSGGRSRAAAASSTAPAEGTWTPVAVPPPTYTLKPVVHRGAPDRFVQDLPDLEPVPAAASPSPFAPAAPPRTGAAAAASAAAGASGPSGAGAGLRPWDADHTWADDLDDVLARRRAVNG